MASKHTKYYSKIIEMQIKTPVRHYFTPISLVIIKKKNVLARNWDAGALLVGM